MKEELLAKFKLLLESIDHRDIKGIKMRILYLEHQLNEWLIELDLNKMFDISFRDDTRWS